MEGEKKLSAGLVGISGEGLYGKISSENFTFLLGFLISIIIMLFGEVLFNIRNN